MKSRARFLYHATSHENVRSILSSGLRAKHSIIYCSEKPDSWRTSETAILQVDIRELDHVKMTRFDEELDEILIWAESIDAALISLC